MDDEKIVGLLFDRSQTAIGELRLKYGKYCYSIAYRVLNSQTDAEECVSDAYLSVWNSVPPQNPKNLKAYIGRVTRNVALNRYDYNKAQKRSSEFETAADELSELSQVRLAVDDQVILKELINKFLASLGKRQRVIFMQRYWYFLSVAEIAGGLHLKENNVKVILHRTREQFKKFLLKEGITV